MLRVENAATPFTAPTVVVPESVPPPGLAPSATRIFPVKVGSVFPCASCAVSCTAGVIAAPATALLGCTANARCVAPPAETLNVELVAVVSPVAPAVRVYPVPALLTLNVENVATPLTAATVVVPERVPLPGFAPMATVTFPVNPVPIRPAASSAVTCTAGVMVPPAATLPGSTVNTSCVNAVMLNWTLETAVRPIEVARNRYPVPGLLMLRSENVATPPTAATVFVPDRVPPPGLEPEGIAIVTLPLNPVATLFPASSAVT